MNDAVLEIEGLTVRSAEGDALVKNVGLCLKRQECLGIAGESGSGKTITAKAILHLLPQDLTASVTHLRVLGEDLLNLTFYGPQVVAEVNTPAGSRSMALHPQGGEEFQASVVERIASLASGAER